MNGTIPWSIGNLTSLSVIELQGNDFTGTFPTSLCTTQLDFMMIIRISDCAQDKTTGGAAMECGCCTACCNANGTNCLPMT